MDSEDIALAIAGGGLLLGVARLAVAILSYRLDARRIRKARSHTSHTLTASEAEVSDDSQQVV